MSCRTAPPVALRSVLPAPIPRLHNIGQQLPDMFGDTDMERDAMLRFTKPVTGGCSLRAAVSACWTKLMALPASFYRILIV